jgi:DNA-binding transcriptional LysR family regulator
VSASPSNITLLVRFVAVAEELHFPRAAIALNIPLASLYSSIAKLEEEVGSPLFIRDPSGTRLTKAGLLLLPTARDEIAAAPAAVEKPAPPAGGKAKASKGKGRAPAVKGQPKPFKKRQGR